MRGLMLLVAGLSLPLSAATVGCRALAAPWLMWGEAPTRLVPAEFPHLAGKRVCVLVWADWETLCEYPFAPLEISEHVAAALRPHVKGISFVPNREVVEYQQRDVDWDRKDPAEIGARFGADRVLFIALTQYTTREPGSPHLFRGHIAASVKVYNTQYRDAEPVYKTSIEVAYPPNSIAPWGTAESALRRATMEAFAGELAGKFYERRVKVR